jgi:hypothetical protein
MRCTIARIMRFAWSSIQGRPAIGISTPQCCDV